jgi:UDP-N-acetylglucosamine 2-epimerase (non-hydrolysing)
LREKNRGKGWAVKVLHVVGARPNFMKIAPIMEEMARHPDFFDQVLIHTGQHYDDEMSQVFFDDLDIPRPDVYLGVGSGSHAEQTARSKQRW